MHIHHDAAFTQVAALQTVMGVFDESTKRLKNLYA